MENQKIEVITIKGIAKKYKISIMTVYKRYLSRLEPVGRSGRLLYFSFEEVQKIAKEHNNSKDKFKIIG